MNGSERFSIMVSQTNTPPPSSPPQLAALDHPASALKRTSGNKRKGNDTGDNGRPTTKRRLRPSQSASEESQTGFVSPPTPSGQAGNPQPPPPVPFSLGGSGQQYHHFPQPHQRQQQQQQEGFSLRPTKGNVVARAFSSAATSKLPDSVSHVHKGPARPQPPPSNLAQPQPPPHSTQNNDHLAYTLSNTGVLSFEQRPWVDPEVVTPASLDGPHYALSEPQSQPTTSIYGGVFQSQAVLPEKVHQAPPIISKKLPGTASHPIVLDDNPLQTVSDTRPAWMQELRQRPAYSVAPSLPSQAYGTVDYSSNMWYTPGSVSGPPQPICNPYGHWNPQPSFTISTSQPLSAQDLNQLVSQALATSLPAIGAADLLKPAAKAPTPKPKARLPMDEPSLCPEQAALVDLIMQGHNVFYTGSAGCGKSTVLRAFVTKLTEMGKTVRIVAPTGRAALNVGGMTTWTFAGWTPNSHKKTLGRLRQEAVYSSKVNKRIKETDVLVIDEISMVENLHFERLNEIMKAVHHQPHTQNAAFGGCQIVVTGDFCQLPPVKPFQHCIECGKELSQKCEPGKKPSYQCRHHGAYADEDKWAFRSKAWEECNFQKVHLKTIHRQNDEPFIRMLQKCRLGSRLSEQEIHLLMHHKSRTAQAMELYPTRKEADDVNRIKFNKIAAEPHTYWAHDSFFWHKEHHPNLQWKGVTSEWRNSQDPSIPRNKRPLKALDEHRYSECVQLKRGGLVVLLTNLDLKLGLCNGSQGVICGFEEYDPNMLPMRDNRGGELSWGKAKKIEPKPGQRVLRGEHAAIQEREIKNFITSECAPIRKWPIVRFHNGQKCTVYAECSISQLGDEEPYSLLARTQLPLAPAWAMTIHKSQSLTLDRVIVNLDRAFEEGQVYVALSRATGLCGLKIEGNGGFLRDKILVNSEVAAFLKANFANIYDGMDVPEVKCLTSHEAS